MSILSLVEIWDGWCVFELGVTDDLKRRLNGEEEVVAGELELSSVQATAAVYQPPWIASTVAKAQPLPTPAPIPDPIERPSKFSKSGFKSTSFQPAPIDDFLPDEEPIKEEEGIDVDGEDIDGEAADVDVDGEEIDGDAMIEPAPVVVALPIRSKKGGVIKDEPMVLDDSDDDIFA